MPDSVCTERAPVSWEPSSAAATSSRLQERPCILPMSAALRAAFSQGPRDPLKGGGGQGLEQAEPNWGTEAFPWLAHMRVRECVCL